MYDLSDYRYIYNNPGTGQFFPGGNQGDNWQTAQTEFQAYSAYRTILQREPTQDEFTGVSQIFKSSGGDAAGYAYLQGIKAQEDAKATAVQAKQDAADTKAADAKSAADEKAAAATEQMFASSYGFAAPSNTKGGTPTADASTSTISAAPGGQPGALLPLVLAAAALFLL